MVSLVFQTVSDNSFINREDIIVLADEGEIVIF